MTAPVLCHELAIQKVFSTLKFSLESIETLHKHQT
jgi:hypothetical protein